MSPAALQHNAYHGTYLKLLTIEARCGSPEKQIASEELIEEPIIFFFVHLCNLYVSYDLGLRVWVESNLSISLAGDSAASAFVLPKHPR